VRYVTRHGRRIAVETIEAGPAPAKKRAPFKAQWVKFPARWIEALKRSKSASAY
jgi:hypothetical protein